MKTDRSKIIIVVDYMLFHERLKFLIEKGRIGGAIARPDSGITSFNALKSQKSVQQRGMPMMLYIEDFTPYFWFTLYSN